MKQICLLFFVFVITLPMAGQTQKGKIFLKNGSVIKGKITDSGSSDLYRVYSAGNLWVFPFSEVEKVEYQFPAKEPKDPENESKIGYHTQIGVLAGNNDNRKPAPFVLHSSFNYKIGDKIRAGLGTGVEFLNETHLPLFANFEYRLNKYSVSPYFFLKAGYTLPLEDSRMYYYDVIPYYSSSSYYWYSTNENVKARGGVLLNPGFGVSSMFSQNFGMTFSVGYRYSRLHYKGEDSYRIDVDYNRLSISMGIVF